MSVTGDVNSTYDTVTDIHIVVKLRAGSEDVDLGKAVIVYTDDDTHAELTNGSTANNDTFATIPIQDDDSSWPVLNSREDVFMINLSLADIRAGTDGATGDHGLGESKEATIKIIPETGATTTYTITVPDSVNGLTKVDLT